VLLHGWVTHPAHTLSNNQGERKGREEAPEQ
jgi:hypothetical protein